jgi:hypothetical protein
VDSDDEGCEFQTCLRPALVAVHNRKFGLAMVAVHRNLADASSWPRPLSNRRFPTPIPFTLQHHLHAQDQDAPSQVPPFPPPRAHTHALGSHTFRTSRIVNRLLPP